MNIPIVTMGAGNFPLHCSLTKDMSDILGQIACLVTSRAQLEVGIFGTLSSTTLLPEHCLKYCVVPTGLVPR